MSYNDGESLIKCAELNLETSALRLRYSAASGQVLKWKGPATEAHVPTIEAAFSDYMAMSGQVVTEADNQNVVVKLYAESELSKLAGYSREIGMVGVSCWLTVKP